MRGKKIRGFLGILRRRLLNSRDAERIGKRNQAQHIGGAHIGKKKQGSSFKVREENDD